MLFKKYMTKQTTSSNHETMPPPPPPPPTVPRRDNSKPAGSKSVVGSCGNCTDGKVILFCSTCQVDLCSACFNSTHKAPMFASHVTLPIKHLDEDNKDVPPPPSPPPPPPPQLTQDDVKQPPIPPQRAIPTIKTGGNDLSKYEKMLKCGLPEGAVAQKMVADGLNPKQLFPDYVDPVEAAKQSRNEVAPLPKPKSIAQIAAAGGSGSPGGMALIEEMKQKQALKQAAAAGASDNGSISPRPPSTASRVPSSSLPAATTSRPDSKPFKPPPPPHPPPPPRNNSMQESTSTVPPPPPPISKDARPSLSPKVLPRSPPPSSEGDGDSLSFMEEMKRKQTLKNTSLSTPKSFAQRDIPVLAGTDLPSQPSNSNMDKDSRKSVSKPPPPPHPPPSARPKSQTFLKPTENASNIVKSSTGSPKTTSFLSQPLRPTGLSLDSGATATGQRKSFNTVNSAASSPIITYGSGNRKEEDNASKTAPSWLSKKTALDGNPSPITDKKMFVPSPNTSPASGDSSLKKTAPPSWANKKVGDETITTTKSFGGGWSNNKTTESTTTTNHSPIARASTTGVKSTASPLFPRPISTTSGTSSSPPTVGKLPTFVKPAANSSGSSSSSVGKVPFVPGGNKPNNKLTSSTTFHGGQRTSEKVVVAGGGGGGGRGSGSVGAVVRKWPP